MNETSQPVELLLSVTRDGGRTLGAQIEEQIRCGVCDGSLRPAAQLPSTRDLARQLGVSRRIVVDAYAQLSAEGYLTLRQGARPAVAEETPVAEATEEEEPQAAPPPLYDFWPSVPDVSMFPRNAWLRSLREAVNQITVADLGYGDHSGMELLRSTLTEYLGRVRGVVASPRRVVVTSGYTQALGIVADTLAANGVKRIAVEDPGDVDARMLVARSGLEPIAIPVDQDGMQIDALAASKAEAVVLTPAHQFPTGGVLSGERRAALLSWLRENDAIAIEDDYDCEYRYDRAAVGALQGLEPDRIVYAGTASKTLAPALRLGWLVVPNSLLPGVREAKSLADRGTARVEQHAFADFLARGELDRHLRRMRTRYRARRDAIVAAVGELIPEATVRGIAAGLHATVELPEGYDEQAIRAEAERRRVAFETMGDYRVDPDSGPPTLVLGYAQITEAAIPAGVAEIAAAIEAVR